MINFRPDMSYPEYLFEKNLAVLNLQQPAEAARVRAADGSGQIMVAMAKSGHPVPLIAGQPAHSLEDPVQESARQIEVFLASAAKNRIIICGFGFGYHLAPLVEEGLSPIVWEPSAAMVAQAFRVFDFSKTLPFVTLVTGDVGPDFTRGSDITMLPVWAHAYPECLDYAGRRMLTATVQSGVSRSDGIFLSTYRDLTCLKNPHDLVLYQMLLNMVRPTLVIEVGAYRGGSAVWIADQLSLMGGDRRVHTYGIENAFSQAVLDHPLVTTHLGGHDAFDAAIVQPDDRVLVIEDSSHTYENTAAVIKKFAPYVSKNSYLIVEDGRAHQDHPELGLNGGPLRASLEFLDGNPDWVNVAHWEDLFGVGTSNCVQGFMRRIR